MAIIITPREQDAPLTGEVVAVTGPFRPPSTIERTEKHAALIEETHEDGVQLLAVGWKQDLVNKINHGLIVSATNHVVQAAVEVEAILGKTPPLGEGTARIVQGAVSAILQQGAATIQQTTVVAMQNAGELATKVPTGQEILDAQEKERKREREREEARERREHEARTRPKSVLEMILGG